MSNKLIPSWATLGFLAGGWVAVHDRDFESTVALGDRFKAGNVDVIADTAGNVSKLYPCIEDDGFGPGGRRNKIGHIAEQEARAEGHVAFALAVLDARAQGQFQGGGLAHGDESWEQAQWGAAVVAQEEFAAHVCGDAHGERLAAALDERNIGGGQVVHGGTGIKAAALTGHGVVHQTGVHVKISLGATNGGFATAQGGVKPITVELFGSLAGSHVYPALAEADLGANGEEFGTTPPSAGAAQHFLIRAADVELHLPVARGAGLVGHKHTTYAPEVVLGPHEAEIAAQAIGAVAFGEAVELGTIIPEEAVLALEHARHGGVEPKGVGIELGKTHVLRLHSAQKCHEKEQGKYFFHTVNVEPFAVLDEIGR